MDWRYIGDGVYVKQDERGGYWLHTGSHDNPDNRVYLEPVVLGSLMQYVEDANRREASGDG